MEEERDKVTIELSGGEFSLLIFALGIAAGSAQGLRMHLIDLANTVNKNNPRWIPYEVSPPRKA